MSTSHPDLKTRTLALATAERRIAQLEALTRAGRKPDFSVTIDDFGARPGGDPEANVDAINAAIAAAVANGGGTVHIPAGVYDIAAFGRKRATDDILTVKPGVCLSGAGRDSVLRLADGGYGSGIKGFQGTMLVVESDCIVRNLRFDGNRHNVHITDPKGRFQAISAVEHTERVLLDELWVHDIGTDGKSESFGINLSLGCSDFVYRNVRAYDNDGTGIHLNSADPKGESDPPFGRHIGIGCEAYRNGWQGLGVFSTTNTVLIDCKAYDNQKNGLSTEWARQLDVYDGNFYGNGQEGGQLSNVNIKGGGGDITLTECHIANSATGRAIQVRAVTHFDLGEEREVPVNITFRDCRVENEKIALWLGGTDDVTDGYASPYNIVIDVEDAANWEIQSRLQPLEGGSERGTVVAACHFPKQAGAPTVDVGSFRDWTKEDGEAQIGRDTVSASARKTGAVLTSNVALPGNHTYLIHARGQQVQPGSASHKNADVWQLRLRRKANSDGVASRLQWLGLGDSNKWREGEQIVALPAGRWLLELYHINNSGGVSSFSLEQLRVQEIG